MGKQDIFLVTLQDTQGDTVVFDYNHAVRIKEKRKKNSRFLRFVGLFNNLVKGAYVD